MLKYFQQLLRRAPASGQEASWQPAAVPTPRQAQRYRAWVAADAPAGWLKAYFKAYHLTKGGAASRRLPRVELLQEENRRGALLFYDAAWQAEHFQFLYQLLSERVAALGYHRACHDQRRRCQEPYHELAVKQLFKPDPTDCPDSGRCNQRFGLVTLDMVGVNDQPLFIRLSTNPVREDCFTAPKTFEELLAAVFSC